MDGAPVVKAGTNLDEDRNPDEEGGGNGASNAKDDEQAKGGPGESSLERRAPNAGSLEQQYLQFIGAPVAHRILRPLHQHSLQARPASPGGAVSFVEERDAPST